MQLKDKQWPWCPYRCADHLEYCERRAPKDHKLHFHGKVADGTYHAFEKGVVQVKVKKAFIW